MNEVIAARLVFPSFKFGRDSIEDAVELARLGVGGFCLYGGRASEIARLTKVLRAKAGRPLLFCADYENGLRSQSPDGTVLPSNMGIGASNSRRWAFEKGRITALEARAIGVDWILAPVVDLAVEPANPIVNIRSFGAEPTLVTRLAGAYLDGIAAGGALSCLKHFPGHGRTKTDSHLKLAPISASKRTLETEDLVPFKKLLPRAPTVMPGHLSVAVLQKNKKIPFSLSPDCKRLLRGRLRYQGLVVTDALDMKAVQACGGLSQVVSEALKAGADILLCPENPRAAIAELEKLFSGNARARRQIRESLERLDRILLGLQKSRANIGTKQIASKKHLDLARRMAQACLAWVGKPVSLAGREIYYWESGRPKEWKGRAFLSALRNAGRKVAPLSVIPAKAGIQATMASGSRPRAKSALVIGSFLGPRAYSGRIQYSPAELSTIQKAAASSKETILVAFGSPFVFDAMAQAGTRLSGLAAFSLDELAQQAAVRVFLGKTRAPGRPSVLLRDSNRQR